MANYFNTLNLREQLDQLGRCRFMDREEFVSEADYLKGKKSGHCGLWCSRSKPRPKHARFWS